MVTILNDDELKEEMSKMRQKLGNRDKYETDAPAAAPSRRPQPPPPAAAAAARSLILPGPHLAPHRMPSFRPRARLRP